MKYFTLILIVFVLLFSSCSSDKKIKSSGKNIKVALFAPLSGRYKRIGQQSMLGINFAKNTEKYISNGDKINFEIIDTKSNSKYAKKIISKLMKKKIVAAISFMPSDNMLKVYGLFQKYKIPVIATVATNNNITRKNGYVSQVCMSNHTQSIIASHYIRDEKLLAHVGVLYDGRSRYSISLAKEFKQSFLKLDGKIDFFIDISQPKNLEKLYDFEGKKTKIIFNSANALLLSRVLKIFDRKSLHVEIVSTDGLLSSALANCKKNIRLFEGIYVIEHFAHNIYRNKEFKILESSLTKEGYKDSAYAFLAYDGYNLLRKALELCKATGYSKKCISKALKNSGSIQGISEKFSIVDYKAKRGVYIDLIKNSLLKKVLIVN